MLFSIIDDYAVCLQIVILFYRLYFLRTKFSEHIAFSQTWLSEIVKSFHASANFDQLNDVVRSDIQEILCN